MLRAIAGEDARTAKKYMVRRNGRERLEVASERGRRPRVAVALTGAFDGAGTHAGPVGRLLLSAPFVHR